MLKRKKFIIKEDNNEESSSEQQDINELKNDGETDASIGNKPNLNSTTKTDSDKSVEKSTADNDKDNDKSKDTKELEEPNKKSSEDNAEQVNIPKKLKQSFSSMKFIEDTPGVFIHKNENVSFGISFADVKSNNTNSESTNIANNTKTTTESVSRFNILYTNLLLEETEEYPVSLKIKDEHTGKEYVFENVLIKKNASAEDIKQICFEYFKKWQAKNGQTDTIKLNGVDSEVIENAMKKLDKEEQDAFVQFYSKFEKEKNEVGKFLIKLFQKLNS